MSIAVFSGIVPGLRASAAALRVRVNTASLKENDNIVLSLRDFVATMRKRPAGKQPNWAMLYQIHGSLPEGFNRCQHQNWYLLPWHRAYLEMYENLVIAVTGNTEFALPYWDWTTQRSYPAFFTTPTLGGQPNPLLSPAAGEDAKFKRAANPGFTDSDVGLAVVTALLQEPNFELFASSRPLIGQQPQNSADPKWLSNPGVAGQLETGPHNKVHSKVGNLNASRIGGFMATPESARDPLFLVHHTNVDRIWESWRGTHPTATFWHDMIFPKHFYLADGTRYSVRSGNVLDIRARGYAYDTLYDVPVRGQAGNTEQLLQSQTVTADDRRVRVLPSPAGTQGSTDLSTFSLTATADLGRAVRAGEDIYAVLRDLVLSESVGGVKLYLNLPIAAVNVPDDDPHFVTELLFLKGGHDGHAHSSYSASVNLGPTLRRLATLGLLQDDTLTLQLAPVYSEGADARRRDGMVVPAAVDIGIP